MSMEKTRLKVCPMVGRPSGECYFLQMNEGNIQKVIDYCTGTFVDCEIFRFHHPEGDMPGV